MARSVLQTLAQRCVKADLCSRLQHGGGLVRSVLHSAAQMWFGKIYAVGCGTKVEWQDFCCGLRLWGGWVRHVCPVDRAQNMDYKGALLEVW